MLLPGCRLGPSGSRAVALALIAGLSALGIGDVSPAWSRTAVLPNLGEQRADFIAQANTPIQTNASSAPNPVLLQPGAEGDEVMMLQRQMRLQGLYQGAVDGRYGEETKAAIAAFQTSVELPPTGTLDQATWQRMSTPQLLANDASAAADLPVLLPSAEGDAAPLEVPEAESLEPATNPPNRLSRRLGWFMVGGLALAVCLGGWLWLGQGKRRSRAGNSPTVLPETNLPPALDPAAPEAPAATDLPLEATTRLSRVDVVDSLVHELGSADSSVRRHAIWELGQRGHSDVIQPLVNGLLEADSQEKSLILAALAEISSRSLKPMHRALALGLQDPSPEVRKNAIRDLSRVYDTVVQLSHMLAHASQDPDPGVQETARWALTQLNRIPTAPYPSEPTALEAAYDDDRQRPTHEGRRIPPS
ncbi:HEAT repeat domain-containing protein [Nodosilinea sp. LEGE 06152]|uniref:HEAT repeat domain-containing protein n=1 Tax=Nodosilinea sp. LEGE 06152 TaxID=2777966 RepID=UPI001881A1A8|nr:HEAT repeat domain-containing protein [Nodosilinea sp. LEGE 06152]